MSTQLFLRNKYFSAIISIAFILFNVMFVFIFKALTIKEPNLFIRVLKVNVLLILFGLNLYYIFDFFLPKYFPNALNWTATIKTQALRIYLFLKRLIGDNIYKFGVIVAGYLLIVPLFFIFIINRNDPFNSTYIHLVIFTLGTISTIATYNSPKSLFSLLPKVIYFCKSHPFFSLLLVIPVATINFFFNDYGAKFILFNFGNDVMTHLPELSKIASLFGLMIFLSGIIILFCVIHMIAIMIYEDFKDNVSLKVNRFKTITVCFSNFFTVYLVLIYLMQNHDNITKYALIFIIDKKVSNTEVCRNLGKLKHSLPKNGMVLIKRKSEYFLKPCKNPNYKKIKYTANPL